MQMFSRKYFKFALKYHELKQVNVRPVAAEYLVLRSLQISSKTTKVVAHVAKLMFSWPRDFPLFINPYSHYRNQKKLSGQLLSPRSTDHFLCMW
jgi:hypothetical protein